MDYDWFVTNANSGYHLADNSILGKKSAFAPELIYSELYNIKAMGFNAVNVWLICDGMGLVFDDDGTVIGLDEEFTENLRTLLGMCRRIGIDCIPSLLPHGIASNYGNGSDTETATEIWNKYFRFYCNAEARQAFTENAIAPLCELLSEYTDVIPICNLTVENTNYADDPKLGYLMGSSVGTTWKNIAALINDMNGCVKKCMPNMLTSTENMGDSFLQFRCNELKVDLIGQNRYAGGNVKDPKEEYLTKPTYLGEFNTGNMTEEQVSASSVRLDFYPNAIANGYKGAFYFSYSTGGDIFSLFDGLQTDPSNLYPFAVKLSDYVRKSISDYRGNADATERPVLLYNRGTGDVYWLAGEKAKSFILEYSDNGGKSFNTAAELSSENCMLENGLYCFKDSGFTDGTSRRYRITAVTEEGEKYTSEMNNTAEYAPLTNLLQDGDFEENGNAWTHLWGGAGSVSEDNPYSGSKCLLVDKENGKGNKSWGNTYQELELQPETAYVLKFNMNITRGSSISIRAYDVENKVNLGSVWLGSTGGEWREGVLKFATCKQNKIQIVINNGSSSDTYAAFDSFVLTELR